MKAGIAAAVFAAEAIRRAGIGHARRSRSAARWTRRAAGSPACTGWRSSAGCRASAQDGDHSRAARRRPRLHRPSRRLLVRSDGRRPHRPWQHAVSRRQRHRGHVAVSRPGARRAEPGARRARHRVPVVPDGSRHATININGIDGGQPVDGVQTPCVADRCRAVFDRRFLLEEGLEATRDEIAALVQKARRGCRTYRFRSRTG